MMRFSSFVLLAVLVLSCAACADKIVPDNAGPMPSSEDATIAQSGMRLKARTLTGQDFSKQFAGWFDTGRQVNCSFQKMGDGQLYCLPDMSRADSATYFFDAACSRQLTTVIVSSASCDAPTMAFTAKSSDACAPDKVVQLNQQFSGVVYTKNGDTCQQVTSVIGPAYYFFEGATEIPLTSFVAAKEQIEW